MKKFISMMLVAALALCAFAGCSGNTAAQETKAPTTASVTEANNEAPAAEVTKELSGNVTFVGYVPHSLMSAYLVKSDVTINSLVRKAAQSIVSKIGDYLASGKPMINTGMDTEFRNKVEADGFGINVEPENVEALADAIEQLYRNPNRCREMGEIARKIGEAQFDRPNSYKKIIHLVDGLVDVEVNA